MNSMITPLKRKKWSEAEERTLIDRYGELISNGNLAKMKTREKKFRPIAFYVNSVHHDRDPLAFPWQWSWKDVSTKVQNMRHQYLLVKQKIKKQEPPPLGGEFVGGVEEFEWGDGLSHWSNFLRYKEVFGDVPLVFSNSHDDSLLGTVNNNNDENGGVFSGSSRGVEMVDFGHLGHSGEEDFAAGIDGGEDGVLSLGFEYDGEEGEENFNNSSSHLKNDGDEEFAYEEVEVEANDGLELRKKKKKKVIKGFEKKAWSCLANQLGQLKEMEMRFEQKELERDRERQKTENLRVEREKEREKTWEERDKERAKREKIMEEMRKQTRVEWETMEKESEERERRRREEVLIQEREWEERMDLRRSEWKKRMDDMLNQHRAEMGQIQSRILHEQQNLTSQLLTIVSQWSGHPSDHTGTSSHYISQVMPNMHHVNGMVHDDDTITRVQGDNQDDQFIVD
ncbi:hypothetical protein SOVF_117680 [Spinacia oleracea]|nr:hypothetical protein SOVF_117680 [Spinacia oleracea]